MGHVSPERPDGRLGDFDRCRRGTPVSCGCKPISRSGVVAAREAIGADGGSGRDAVEGDSAFAPDRRCGVGSAVWVRF